ncbi:HNH endonuclease, partial [Nocardioides hankookensis]
AADRRVTLRPAPDVMARLSALLPATQGIAVWATLRRAADRARVAGDPRSRGQIMADVLVERVTGQATAEAVPVQVALVVSDQTLLGGGVEPGWLQDYGPVTAETARDLTKTALAEATVALRRVYARPETGALVAMDSRSRTFPRALGQFLEVRDRTCRSPWCDAPIRHHDHVRDHARGGATTAGNGQGLCEQCNHLKQSAGWRARDVTGPGELHTIETCLPTGHRQTSGAPRAPTPAVIRIAYAAA